MGQRNWGETAWLHVKYKDRQHSSVVIREECLARTPGRLSGIVERLLTLIWVLITQIYLTKLINCTSRICVFPILWKWHLNKGRKCNTNKRLRPLSPFLFHQPSSGAPCRAVAVSSLSCPHPWPLQLSLLLNPRSPGNRGRSILPKQLLGTAITSGPGAQSAQFKSQPYLVPAVSLSWAMSLLLSSEKWANKTFRGLFGKCKWGRIKERASGNGNSATICIAYTTQPWFTWFTAWFIARARPPHSWKSGYDPPNLITDSLLLTRSLTSNMVVSYTIFTCITHVFLQWSNLEERKS